VNKSENASAQVITSDQPAGYMKSVIWLIAAILLTLPWLALVLMGEGHHLLKTDPKLTSFLTGISIIGAAFVLSWGAELAERDIPRSLALIALALISVLPEYAVDLNYAWDAGQNPAYKDLPVANMTGANRVLIGVGWPLVALIFYFKFRRNDVPVDRSQSLELSLLLLATVYSFILPIKGTLSLYDMVIFFAMFLLYAARAAGGERHEVELEGIAKVIDAKFGNRARRLIVVAMFAFSGYLIWLAADPFAEGLKMVGENIGVSPFLIVQWIAPLASESPEVVIALLFALKGKGSTGIGALISSKVNQWTLLVGAIPLVYAISAGAILPLDLDSRQREELLLTSAQSIFAAIVISDFRFSLKEAMLLFVFFIGQFIFPTENERYIFSGIYIAAAITMIATSKTRRQMLIRALMLKSGDD